MNPVTAPKPLGLIALLMRRAAWVAAGVLSCTLLLGLAAMSGDMDNEAKAAAALATQLAALTQLAATPDPRIRRDGLHALRERIKVQPVGHLLVHLQDGDGATLLASTEAVPPSQPMQWLLRLHERMAGAPQQHSTSWILQLPDGNSWTLSLRSAPQAERHEAMQGLLQMLAMMLLCVGGLLLALRSNLRRALAPLGQLLHAISRIEHRDDRAVQTLQPMPVHELESMAAALRHLSRALHAAEEQRRLLGQRVISLQEDERARLGRELHDEFGQHLTALRVDAAWLSRQGVAQGQSAQVLDGIQTHVRQIQQQLRGILTRLRPLGPGGALDGSAAMGAFTLGHLAALLENLVASWHGKTGSEQQMSLTLIDASRAGPPAAWAKDTLQQPMSKALGLAIYRITQEALTNAIRHANATRVLVMLRLRHDECLDWSVEDDGIGLPDTDGALWHGSGLGGIRERIWALGADLQLQPARACRPRPGLRLQARLQQGPQLPTPAPIPPDDDRQHGFL